MEIHEQLVEMPIIRSGDAGAKSHRKNHADVFGKVTKYVSF